MTQQDEGEEVRIPLLAQLMQTRPALLIEVRDGRMPAKDRLLTFMCALTHDAPLLDGMPGVVCIPRVTRSEIAECLGIATETVSRVMAEWVRGKRTGYLGSFLWWRR